MASLSLDVGKTGTGEAWAFLSDPLRKASFDSDLAAAVAAKAAAACAPTPSPEKQQPKPPLSPRPASSPLASYESLPAKRGRPPCAAKLQQPLPERLQDASYCHVRQYNIFYKARSVLCPSCRQPFFATAMPTSPPVVPGTDMCFPMGFPGGPVFAGSANSLKQQPPVSLGFYPMGPYLLASWKAMWLVVLSVDSEVAVSATVTAAVPVAPLPVKSTHVKVGSRKRGRPKGSKNKNVVNEIN